MPTKPKSAGEGPAEFVLVWNRLRPDRNGHHRGGPIFLNIPSTTNDGPGTPDRVVNDTHRIGLGLSLVPRGMWKTSLEQAEAVTKVGKVVHTLTRAMRGSSPQLSVFNLSDASDEDLAEALSQTDDEALLRAIAEQGDARDVLAVKIGYTVPMAASVAAAEAIAERKSDERSKSAAIASHFAVR